MGVFAAVAVPRPPCRPLGVLDRAQTKVRAPVMPANRAHPSSSVVAATAGSQFQLFLRFFHRPQLGVAGACRSWSAHRIGPVAHMAMGSKMNAAGDSHANSRTQVEKKGSHASPAHVLSPLSPPSLSLRACLNGSCPPSSPPSRTDLFVAGCRRASRSA